MTHGVKVNDAFLDLFNDTTFDFQLNSPAYFGGSNDVIQSSLVFTVRVPNTPRNAELLRKPAEPSNDYDFYNRHYAELWADGGLLFDGALTITEATEDGISFRILINALGALKEMLLEDIKVATEVDLGENPTVTAKLTATSPLDYPFVFFPVYNPTFLNADGFDVVIPQQFQNYYAVDGAGQFYGNGPNTPFLRLDYVLEKMFETIGFTLNNQFQITDELRKMVLYNNYDANQNGKFPKKLNLKNHLPQKIKCGEFLSKVCRLFNLAPFVDAFAKTVELYPMREAMRNSTPLDWSDKILSDWRLSQEFLDVPSKIGYKDYLKSTGREYYYEQDFDLMPVKTIDKIHTASSLPNVVYFEKTTDTYYFKVTESYDATVLTRQVSPLKSDTGKGEPFYSELIGATNEHIALLPNFEMGFIPFLRVSGSNATKTVESPLILMMYRGMQPVNTAYHTKLPVSGRLYPHASMNVYNAVKERIGTDSFSLQFRGEFGIGENCIGDWYQLLQRKKNMTARVDLSVAELRTFSFKQKIHIKGMDYFAKSLKGQISEKGLLPVEVDMCTTII